MFTVLLSLLACNTSGSVIIDKDPIDTASVDDTGGDIGPDDTTETDDTETEETDTEDTNTDDTDTEDTNPNDTDTEEPVLPEDNNNPSIDVNYWEGQRTLTYGDCSESVVEYGYEITNDYPNWLAVCNCDELYYVQMNASFACGIPIDYNAFYRAVRYDGMEISIQYWPESPTSPTSPIELAVGTIVSQADAENETWGYQYTVQTYGETLTINGELSFLE